MNKYIYTVLISIFYFTFAPAQPSGEHIFDTKIVHEIRFEFKETNFWRILTENYVPPHSDNKTYLLGNVIIDGELIDSVGVRLKGSTSYGVNTNKKPIKIDFNEFVKDQRFDGLRKINLMNGEGDPSLQRDFICYELLRKSGIAAPRTSYSKVYFNNKFWGLYVNIEQIDNSFIADNFDNQGGNLFKNRLNTNFEWKSNELNWPKPYFDLKTNKKDPNWDGLINFHKVLNSTSNQNFKTEIEKILDVDSYLKILAVNVATNHWDSNLRSGRNWYMYEDIQTGKFHWIPWDYNYALGGNAFVGAGGWNDGACLIVVMFSSETDGSTTVKFKDESFFSNRPNYLWEFGDGNTSRERNPAHTYNKPGEYKVCLTITIGDICDEKECKMVNIDFNPSDCPSITNGTCPYPANKTFKEVLKRYPECCENWSSQCEDFYQIKNKKVPSGFIIDQRKTIRLLTRRLLNVNEYYERYLDDFCDLMNTTMTEDYLYEIMDNNKDLIKDIVKTDVLHIFPYDEFLEDIGIKSDTLGLKKYLHNRIIDLKNELDTISDCSVTSYNQVQNNIGINIYPNPTSQTINININGMINGSSYQINICSIEGKLLFQKKYNSSNIQINRSELTNGLYIIQIIDEQGITLSKKIILK